MKEYNRIFSWKEKFSTYIHKAMLEKGVWNDNKTFIPRALLNFKFVWKVLYTRNWFYNKRYSTFETSVIH